MAWTERLLAMTEKPANIVRRRLEQAGWDYSGDDFRALAGEDIQYLMKFVYKSNVLGGRKKLGATRTRSGQHLGEP